MISQEDWARIQSRLDSQVQEAQVQTSGDQGAGDQEVERLRGELKEAVKERDHLASNCEKYKEDLSNEAKFRKEMEVTWNSRGEEYRCRSATVHLQ